LLGRLVILGKTPEKFELDQRTYDEHMRMILVEMLVGGVESVNKALANWLDVALDRPAVLEHAKSAARDGKDEEIDALVREGLRLNPVSPVLFRVAAKDTRLGDQDIKAGSIIALLIEAAMRDPRQFPNPDGFDVDARQHNPPYLHFGAGLHHCFGSELATVELRELVKALVRLGKLRRAAGPLGRTVETFRLPTSLAVRFNPS
jgi:cytochrome P450